LRGAGVFFTARMEKVRRVPEDKDRTQWKGVG
jgi:hypothetical protein